MRGAKPSTSRRVDARRNREVILRVADEAFLEGSDEVALDDIARRAGLGRATVYRHFPDRAALGLAVATEKLARMRADTGERGARSFRELLLTTLADQVARRPLVRLFHRLPVRLQHQYIEALMAVLEPPFRHAQAEGLLRRDVELADVMLVFEMVEAALASGFPGTHGRESTQRLIRVIVDGLFVVPAV